MTATSEMKAKCKELAIKVSTFGDSQEVYAVDYLGARFYPETYSVGARQVWLDFSTEEKADFFRHGLAFLGIENSGEGRTVSVPRYTVEIKEL